MTPNPPYEHGTLRISRRGRVGCTQPKQEKSRSVSKVMCFFSGFHGYMCLENRFWAAFKGKPQENKEAISCSSQRNNASCDCRFSTWEDDEPQRRGLVSLTVGSGWGAGATRTRAGTQTSTHTNTYTDKQTRRRTETHRDAGTQAHSPTHTHRADTCGKHMNLETLA